MSIEKWIAERRRIEQDAPPAPWRYREGAYGDPANGPDYTAITAIHPEHGEQSIATGDYDSWSGLGLAFAEDARTSLPLALKALEAVLRLHEPVLYASERIREVRPTLPSHVCTGCWDGPDGAVPWPCPTVQAVTRALTPEADPS